jgi:diguanylate cyclase (GGDEF)-like protein
VSAVLAVRTDWRLLDSAKFFVLVWCGMISMASTPRVMYSHPGVTRDFSTTWVLPTAILLPPVYVALISVPIVAVLQFYVHPGVLHRRVFTVASLSLSYVATSLAFRLIPASFAGGSLGTGMHAFSWCLAVAGCEILGCRVQHFLIAGAVKVTNPAMRAFSGQFTQDALQGLFVEIDLAVLITLAVAVSPALVVLALPTVLLVRRFLVHPILVAQSRVDAKTGLLNVSTWEAEAEAELSRAVRLRAPLAVLLVDIDHFKLVNDTYGHLAGDRVLKSIASALTGQSRDYDRAGRFGGEEFVLLLAQTTQDDACSIARRLRGHIESLVIPVDDRPDAPTLKVTISIGVTALACGTSYELTDLLAAADSAMYAAKQAGRNQVAFALPLHDMGLDAAWDADTEPARPGSSAHQAAGTSLASTPLSGHRVELVQSEPRAVSLDPRTSLSVPDMALHDAAMAPGRRPCPARPQSAPLASPGGRPRRRRAARVTAAPPLRIGYDRLSLTSHRI